MSLDESQAAEIQCPYCGEAIELYVDCSVRRQVYIEDCSVCCRPITVTLVSVDGQLESLEARSEDD